MYNNFINCISNGLCCIFLPKIAYNLLKLSKIKTIYLLTTGYKKGKVLKYVQPYVCKVDAVCQVNMKPLIIGGDYVIHTVNRVWKLAHVFQK